MGRKKFEEAEYDPFEQDRLRKLGRQVSAPKEQVSPVEPSTAVDQSTVTEATPAATNVVAIPQKRNREYTSLNTSKLAHGSQKSRTFKCSSVAQDKELDGFLSRLKEITGTDLPFQVMARAAIAATMRAEEQIAEVVKKKPAMKRPANVAAAEYAQFEQYWADVVVEALRKLRPYQ